VSLISLQYRKIAEPGDRRGD